MRNALVRKSPILFADDTTLTYSHSKLSELVSIINSELVNLSHWLMTNKLTLNHNKTTFMCFQNHTKCNSTINLLFNGLQITQVPHARILGVDIDNKLSWRIHIENVNKKLISTLFIMHKIKHKINNSIALNIYNSLFKSRLCYCLLIWGNACPSYLNATFILQKKFLKSCLLLPLKTSTTYLFTNSKQLSLQSLYKLQMALLLHKFYYSPSLLPLEISKLFTDTTSIHTHSTRTHNALELYNFSSSTQSRKLTVKFSAPTIWNTIPISIRALSSLPKFKSCLRQYYQQSLPFND
jgi:hypothetical protein